MNWPAINQPRPKSQFYICDQCGKYIRDRKLAWFSDAKKDLDFCCENCHSKWKGHNSLAEELKKQLKKEINHKTIWMVIAIRAVSALLATFLILWFSKKEKKKTKINS